MSTPTINVNLASCQCAQLMRAQYVPGRNDVSNGHHVACPGIPVPVPLSLEPHRSFSCVVVLGECRCTSSWAARGPDGEPRHTESCPARPITVAASISGKTWEESEVTEIEIHESANPLAQYSAKLLAAVREHWALVKALVTGRRGVAGFTPPPQCFGMMAQRDSVFSALADMARDEDMHEANRHALFAACPAIFPKGGVSPRPREDRPSARNLAAYVEHIVEQVSNLP